MAAPASKTPRIRVAAAIPVGSGLIVVRQHKGDASYWLLPGGGVSWGESLAGSLVREVREEIGLDVAVDRLLFVNDSVAPDGSKHVVNLTFLAHAVSPVDAVSPLDPAIDAVDTVPFGRLESIDLRPPVAKELVAFFGDGRLPSTYLGPRWTPGVESRGDQIPRLDPEDETLHKP